MISGAMVHTSEELIVEILHLKEISCAFSLETKICSDHLQILETQS